MENHLPFILKKIKKERSLIFALLFMLCGSGTSQAQYGDLTYTGARTVRINFTNSVLQSGTLNYPGAIYRFLTANTSQHIGSDYPGNVNFALISIRGTVFNDANGLFGTSSNTVNGIGTNAGGELFATLYDVTNSAAIITVPVNADGTYIFDGINEGTSYSVYIGNVNTTLGQAALPTTTLPTGWVNTGENLRTVTGSDASVNGIVVLGTVNENVVNANFGIERIPTSTAQSFTITTPVGGSFRTLNGAGTTTDPGPLKGSDPEDQPTVGSLSGKIVLINTLPTNGNQLFYNNVRVTTTNFNITNYNPDLLQIKFTGAGSASTSFTYSYVDLAGKASASPATYAIDWTTVLPVKLVSFTAAQNASTVKLVWEVSAEINVEKYDVLQSSDGVNFNTIGNVNATGAQLYVYTDESPIAGVSYYRLRAVDIDGKISLSDIRKISFGSNSRVSVYPNPASNRVTLSITGELLNKAITMKLIAADGKVVLQSNIARTASTEMLDVSKVAAGSYILIITAKEGETVNSKIQIVR